MSMKPMYRRCKKCGQYFSYNPSVGNFSCPYCSIRSLADFIDRLTDSKDKKGNIKQ